MLPPPTYFDNAPNRESSNERASPPTWQLPPAVEILARARSAMANGYSFEGERLYRLILGFGSSQSPEDQTAVAAARVELSVVMFSTARPKEALDLLDEHREKTLPGAGMTLLAEARRTAGQARDALLLARKGEPPRKSRRLPFVSHAASAGASKAS